MTPPIFQNGKSIRIKTARERCFAHPFTEYTREANIIFVRDIRDWHKAARSFIPIGRMKGLRNCKTSRISLDRKGLAPHCVSLSVDCHPRLPRQS